VTRANVVSWASALTLGALSLAGCPEPFIIEEPDFELEIPPRPLQGLVDDEPWSVFQSFAFVEDDGSATLFLAPEPVTACDEVTAEVEGVLVVRYTEPGLQPWSETATNTLTLPDDASVSTTGGGIDLAPDLGEVNIVGGLVFDFDDSTKLEGEVTVPICP